MGTLTKRRKIPNAWIDRNSEGTEFYIIYYTSGVGGRDIKSVYRFNPVTPVQDAQPSHEGIPLEMEHRIGGGGFMPLGRRPGGISSYDTEKTKWAFPHQSGIIHTVFEREARKLNVLFPDSENEFTLHLDWNDEELDQGIMIPLGTTRGLACILSTHARPNEVRVLLVEDGLLVRDVTLKLPRSLGYKVFDGWRMWLEIDGEGKHLVFLNRWPPPPGLKSDAYVANLETGEFTSVRTPRGKVLWGARMGDGEEREE